MRWNFLRRRDLRSAAERFAAEHSAWLTRATMLGTAYPRIPKRPVDRGGYDRLRARPGGVERAERWWGMALERVDRDS